VHGTMFAVGTRRGVENGVPGWCALNGMHFGEDGMASAPPVQATAISTLATSLATTLSTSCETFATRRGVLTAWGCKWAGYAVLRLGFSFTIGIGLGKRTFKPGRT
jgi:hypothetical protein